LLTGAKDGGLKWWAAHRPGKRDLLPDLAQPLGFSSNGELLAAFDIQNQSILLFNLLEHRVTRRFPLQSRSARATSSVAVDSGLAVIVEGMVDGRVRFLDTVTGSASFLQVSQSPVDHVVLSPDGNQLVTGAATEPWRWWDLATGANQTLEKVDNACFSSDSLTLAVHCQNGNIELWDTRADAPTVNIPVDRTSGSAVLFCPDWHVLATIDSPLNEDNAVRLWDSMTGKPLGAFVGHKQPVRSIACSPDGKTLASCSDDSTLVLWNTATQQELLRIRLEDGPADNLRFSPDGTLLVAASASHSNSRALRVFRAPSPREVTPLPQAGSAR
jgi:WD40 repeat protein